jgi:UDP-N-acetylglucosamine 3-dehydrogenase
VENGEEMTDKAGVAVVGVGFVGGQAHAPSFKKIEDSNLVALCDTVESRVKPLAERLQVRYFLDYDKLLEQPDVQAVVLAVPTPLHFDLSMKAIQKGKHVLCEMPLAPKVEQMKALASAAEKAKVVLMPDLNFRFAPIYNKCKKLIDAGTIGKPIALHYREFIPATSLAEQWPPGSWAWNAEKSGGFPDFTLSVWSIDMIRWMFGCEITDVEWMTSYPEIGKLRVISYNTMGIIRLSNSMVGSLHYSASVVPSASTSRLEVFGDNANVLHGIGTDKLLLYRSDPTPQETNLEVKGARVWGHRQIDEHFIDCILNHRQPQATVNDAIKAVEIASKMTKGTKK